MTQTLRQAAGSLLIAGLEGPELADLDRAWLRLIQPAGIILFRRNIESAAQTRSLLADATQYCTPHHLRCIDLEGGLVDRLRDAVAPQPSAQAVARTGKPALMQKHGSLIARECHAFGFNTTLAPVLDLGLPISAQVMRTRAASPDPVQITIYVEHFLKGLNADQITGCAKHFPGLGGGVLDSHHHTPYIDRTYTQIWAEDLAPYRALSRQLPMVMVSHAAYPQTRGAQKPATISPFWITQVLKQRIHYRGLIFSDDMEMGGILNLMPIEEAAPLAIRAGIHLIEICRSPELILCAFESLLHHAERSAAFRKILLIRAAESRRLRTRRFIHPIGRQATPVQLTRLADEIRKFSATVEAAQSKAGEP
jgi:beta-N-acetylhexosaminidase